jgi:hypothetical protein
MERIARGKVKYVGYFESDLIRCASDPIRNLLEEALRVFEIDEAALICPHAEWIEQRLPTPSFLPAPFFIPDLGDLLVSINGQSAYD